MFEYDRYGIKIASDFEIRVVYEDEIDLDLFIGLTKRPMDLFIRDLPGFINDRIQLDNVGSVLVRLSKEEGNTLSTIHFLQNIDIQSSIINLVIDYSEVDLRLEEDEYKNRFYIK